MGTETMCVKAVIAVLLLTGKVLASEPAAFSAADVEFFEREVRPLLVEHCYECHSDESDELKGSYRLDSRAAALAGGDTGAAIVPGKPAESLLVDAVRYGELYQMPPESKLPAEAIATLVEWVRRGAPWPAESIGRHHPVGEKFDLEARKQAHWAWRPLSDPEVPEVKEARWPVDPLDRFILAQLEANGLRPAEQADPRALIRRVSFDLIGLPPSPERVEAFVTAQSPTAFVEIVDELLASPQFGEQWGRHWLDLMRYAETRGHEFDYRVPNAWQYRDYVIRAFNADVPYDRLVTEHLAGDLLQPPRRNASEGFNESVLGTAFWYLGDWVHSPVDVRHDEMNRFDNAIDVFGKAFLGLTVSCARCHDHKFDAIGQADYYALAGFLKSSAYRQVRFETAEQNQETAEQLDLLERETGSKLAAEIAKLSNPLLDGFARLHNEASGDEASEKVSFLESELEQCAADESHALYPLSLAHAQGIEAYREWVRLAAGTEEVALSETAQVVVDFRRADEPWLVDGPAYGTAPRRAGDLIVGEGDGTGPSLEIVDRSRAEVQAGLADLSLAAGTEHDAGVIEKWQPRAGRVLRTPSVELQGGKFYYLMRGGAQVHAVVDSHRMINGPLHQSHLKDVASEDQLRWVEHDLTAYRGHRAHVEFAPRENEPFALYMVVESDTMPVLAVDSPAVIVARAVGDVQAVKELIDRYAAMLREALAKLTTQRLADSPAHRELAQWVASSVLGKVGLDREPLLAIFEAYEAQRKELLSEFRRESATAPAIWDGVAEDEFVLVRGNVRTPGRRAPRAMLTAISGRDQAPLPAGSGRLELARRLLTRENPFPSRVMVNRVWHHLLGRGIVPTVDDFGALGQAPTHPKLLDHLATRFIEEGWSVKRLIRSIVLSRTYQMSTQANARAAEVDPANRLFHRMPSRRLQAEAIRDALLAVSGEIDLKQFGPSVPVYLTDFMQGRGRPKKSGPLDGGRRRSIYLSVRRNFLSPMMLAFDAPQPVGPMGRRTVSNVPAQALIMMNDPFVAEQARHFARRLLKGADSVEACLDDLYMTALSRPPDEQELTFTREFLTLQAVEQGLDPEQDLLHEDLWTDLCHAVFNTKEFIFLR